MLHSDELPVTEPSYTLTIGSDIDRPETEKVETQPRISNDLKILAVGLSRKKRKKK